MSTIAAAARRAGALFVEPPPARAAPAASLDVVVAALAAGAGEATVARGVALALGATRPVELSLSGGGVVAPGPGTAVVRSAGSAAALHGHRGAGRLLVAVADGRREPAVAALVRDVLSRRHDVVLVANRARDAGAWREQGAVTVPDSRLGALLLARRHRPPGTMGAAFDALAARLEGLG